MQILVKSMERSVVVGPVAYKCPVTTPLPATCRLHSGRHAAVVRSNNQRRGTDMQMQTDICPLLRIDTIRTMIGATRTDSRAV